MDLFGEMHKVTTSQLVGTGAELVSASGISKSVFHGRWMARKRGNKNG